MGFPQLLVRRSLKTAISLPTSRNKGFEGEAMIRFLIIGLVFLAIWLAVTRAIRFAQTREIDWTGVAFMIGFVVLAFYLREITGI